MPKDENKHLSCKLLLLLYPFTIRNHIEGPAKLQVAELSLRTFFHVSYVCAGEQLSSLPPAALHPAVHAVAGAGPNRYLAGSGVHHQ